MVQRQGFERSGNLPAEYQQLLHPGHKQRLHSQWSLRHLRRDRVESHCNERNLNLAPWRPIGVFVHHDEIRERFLGLRIPPVRRERTRLHRRPLWFNDTWSRERCWIWLTRRPHFFVPIGRPRLRGRQYQDATIRTRCKRNIKCKKFNRRELCNIYFW